MKITMAIDNKENGLYCGKCGCHSPQKLREAFTMSPKMMTRLKRVIFTVFIIISSLIGVGVGQLR